MLASNEVKTLIIALGTAIAEDFNIEKLRYHRIIIMTDADVDGSHIRALLLTLFYRYFRPLIDMGYIYIAQPPLYRIQAGKTLHYAYAEEQKDALVAQIAKQKKENAKDPKKKEEKEQEGQEQENKEGLPTQAGEMKISGVNIQRYKGLGEMNPDQLWETTMNPANRVLLRVTIDDAKTADHLFSVLMGDEVAPRKKFIQTYAKSVKNLDI
ncbi:MAG: hypothetical protein HYV78_01325 [Candidatus Wildermuthbacteria bacterium]|nr:hypothetical protein [Candidatus Wildermuthbacteria bacterium]